MFVRPKTLLNIGWRLYEKENPKMNEVQRSCSMSWANNQTQDEGRKRMEEEAQMKETREENGSENLIWKQGYFSLLGCN